MKPARKRKITRQGIDTKHIENANVIILRYLKNNKNCEFGELFEYVNSELGKKNHYSRKGFSLRLEKLILSHLESSKQNSIKNQARLIVIKGRIGFQACDAWRVY